jgi:hypothetical protein
VGCYGHGRYRSSGKEKKRVKKEKRSLHSGEEGGCIIGTAFVAKGGLEL